MITTVTPNPSIDRTLFVDQLSRGGVVRAVRATTNPGGKGVNAAIALARNGLPSVAVVPSGGPAGERMLTDLDVPGLRIVAVPVAAPLRSNVSLVEPDGTTTKINEPGAPLSHREVDELLATAVTESRAARWLVGSGSLPPNVGEDFYARMISAAGTTVAVDTSGGALVMAVEAGATLVKPNLDELLEVTGGTARTFGDVIDAARALRGRGDCQVLVSLGADGAILVGADVWQGEAPVARLVSAVGAGDALLSGFLASGDLGRVGLAAGLAWAAASCGQPNSEMPGPTVIARQTPRVNTRIDTARVLSQPGETR